MPKGLDHQGFGVLKRGPRWRGILCLAGLLALLSGCGVSSTVGADATATSTPPATATVAAATSTPVAGVCSVADFPPPILQGPATVGDDRRPYYGAPITDFAFPAGTFYADQGHVTGRSDWKVCSPGDPAAILAFMRTSIAASTWTLLSDQDPQSIRAQQPASPTAYVSSPTPGATPAIYCRTLAITVGSLPGYPGEWMLSVFSPATICQ